MEEIILKEEVIVNLVKDFLINKQNGNCHEESAKVAKNHEHGPDIVLVGSKKNDEHFIIECKGKSYAKSHKSINREGWLNALGQIITRMETPRVIQTGKSKGRINQAYK